MGESETQNKKRNKKLIIILIILLGVLCVGAVALAVLFLGGKETTTNTRIELSIKRAIKTSDNTTYLGGNEYVFSNDNVPNETYSTNLNVELSENEWFTYICEIKNSGKTNATYSFEVVTDVINNANISYIMADGQETEYVSAVNGGTVCPNDRVTLEIIIKIGNPAFNSQIDGSFNITISGLEV